MVYLERGHFFMPSFDFWAEFNNTRNTSFLAKMVCVRALFEVSAFSANELQRRRKSCFSSRIKNTPTKESFLRDTKPFFMRGGRQRRRCETTRNNKETDDKTNNCGGSSPFCIFSFRAGVAPHLRFFLRFSFSCFFLRARRFSICVSCFWRWLPHRSF